MDSEGEDDIILEHETQQDEENDEQQIEHVENEAAEDNGEDEDKEKKVVKPKRVVRNPQPKLNAETLKGSRGVTALKEIFAKRKFKGKGHEEEDLRQLLKTYEYWAHRMFPKYPFDECVERIEKLGNKKPVITLIKKIRMNLMDEVTEQQDLVMSEDEEGDAPQPTMETRFDDLLERQPAAPKQLTEEQLERIRVNKERAQQLRQERLRKIQQQAESKLGTSGELPVRVDSHVFENRFDENELPNEINTINKEDVVGPGENLEGDAENIDGLMENIEGFTENIENTQGGFTHEYDEEPLSQVIGSNRFDRSEFQVNKNKALVKTLNVDTEVGEKAIDNNDKDGSDKEEEMTSNEHTNSQELKISEDAMEID